MVRLDGVSKSFDGRVALESIELDLPLARTFALIGPSGCGKSTLLRIVVGLIPPDSGHVTIDGTPMDRRSARSLRRRIGYVIQDGGLFPHLTARRNASLAAEHLGWPRQRVRDRLRDLAELTRMPEDALDRYPIELSGGQRQRVGLMRGLFLDPDLLLLDEPLAALDPMVRSRLQEDLREIFRRLRKTVLLVTHDLAEAAYLGDEVGLMREGRIVQRGTLPQMRAHPAEPFVTEFLRAQRLLDGGEGRSDAGSGGLGNLGARR